MLMPSVSVERCIDGSLASLWSYVSSFHNASFPEGYARYEERTEEHLLSRDPFSLSNVLSLKIMKQSRLLYDQTPSDCQGNCLSI